VVFCIQGRRRPGAGEPAEYHALALLAAAHPRPLLRRQGSRLSAL